MLPSSSPVFLTNIEFNTVILLLKLPKNKAPPNYSNIYIKFYNYLFKKRKTISCGIIVMKPALIYNYVFRTYVYIYCTSNRCNGIIDKLTILKQYILIILI